MSYPPNLERLVAALDTIEEAIAIYDPEDRLVAFNGHYVAWREAIGGDVTLGVRWNDLVEASVACGAIPEAIGREAEWLEHRRRARGSYSIVRELADGRAFKVNERRMADGGIAVVWTEISELVKAERERSQALVSDEQHLQTMGHLTAYVAHDFNNLLTAVIGNLALLREHLPAENARAVRLFDNAQRGAERGAALVERLLAFSRRKPMPEPSAVDLAAVMGGMSDLLRSALGASVQVNLKLPPRLPPVLVDPGQLELALLNLAVNARDAMNGAGQLTIAAHEATACEPNGDAASFIVVSVSDTGTGMDGTTLARAIEPLFTTKEKGKGTGLGLSMVHSLAARSGGRLVMKSAVGQGTTAELWLPQAGAATPDSSMPPDAC
jgi:signal transduction histidine kinase